MEAERVAAEEKLGLIDQARQSLKDSFTAV
jgi:hypothetical protein